MILPDNLQRLSDESLEDYLIRLWDNHKEYGVDKYTIANLMNAEANTDYDESKWRKDYASHNRWKPYFIEKNLDKEITEKYERLRIESEKERIRNQDQKREYRKVIRNQARFEKLQQDIHNAVLDLEIIKPLPHHTETFKINGVEKQGLALFSDWHFGADIENNHNRYNKDIFNKRVRELVDKIIEHGIKHNISVLHIGQLGDLLNGNIHVSTRVQANEDLIEQIKYVSERLAEIINELSQVFPKVVYYNVIGNHARAGKKDEVGLNENFEYLVPWFLEARLRDIKNVEIIVDKDGYIETKVYDEDIILVHGNFDHADKAVVKLPQLLGYVPDYIMGGHVHHNYLKEHGKTTTMVNGSLMGLDDYATQGRFASKPSQKFLVFDKNSGLECEYTIKLHKIQ